MDTDKRISDEIKRLNTLFKKLDKVKLKTIDSLIRNAAFMTVTLEDLQAHINEHGTISEYKNGENQFGTKKSPEVDIYNTMIKNHTAIIKQLTDLTKPTTNQGGEYDGFEKFVNKR